MSFFVHSPNGTITIDGETFDLDLFMKVFPDYSLPQGMEKRKYIQCSLDPTILEIHFIDHKKPLMAYIR